MDTIEDVKIDGAGELPPTGPETLPAGWVEGSPEPPGLVTEDTGPSAQVPLELKPVVQQPRIYRKDILNFFQRNQLVQMGGVVFSVHKITHKDLILRPVGIAPQNIPVTQPAVL